jgi:hypothetical protein
MPVRRGIEMMSGFASLYPTYRTINKLYRSNMTAEELYEATRGIWVVGTRRENAEYVMAVYLGIVREVYRIQKWHPSVTLKYNTRESKDVNIVGHGS